MLLKKILACFMCIFFLNSCTGFHPLYKNNIKNIYALQNFTIVANSNSVSNKIKKELITLFPSKKKNLYILKIEASIQSVGIVSDASRKISRYKVETLANIKIYQRKKNFDKLIYSFYDKKMAPYNLISDNVRSTLASRKNAESITIRLISESIYKRILIFLTKSQ